MRKPRLKSLAGAALLLLVGAQIATAGSDGTCEDYNREETAASEAPATSTPVPTASADYTKIAQSAPAAGSNVTLTSATIGTAVSALPGQKADREKIQTDSLLQPNTDD
jgi:hypothetical protein